MEYNKTQMNEVVEETTFNKVVNALMGPFREMGSQLSNAPTPEDRQRQKAQAKIDLSVHTMD